MRGYMVYCTGLLVGEVETRTWCFCRCWGEGQVSVGQAEGAISGSWVWGAAGKGAAAALEWGLGWGNSCNEVSFHLF